MLEKLSDIRILVLLLILLVFFPFPEFRNNLLWGPISDSVHIFLGVLICFIYTKIITLKANLVFNSKYSSVILAILTALIIEIVQPIFDRSASFHDFWLSAIGSLCLFYYLNFKYRYLVVVGIVAVVSATVPIFHGYRLGRARASQFPVIVRGNSPLNELIETTIDSTQEINFSGCSSLFLPKSKYSGIEIPLGLQDWSGYKSLIIEVNNLSDEKINLGLRIDDKRKYPSYYERFNRHLNLEIGLNSIVIPIEDISSCIQQDKFDLENVRKIFLFSIDDTSVSAVCVRSIMLAN